MSKNIKLVALVGGEEVDVGRCHPGQARILRKQGLAEWVKDKLVLTQSAKEAQEPMAKLKSLLGRGWEPVEGAERSLKIEDRESWKDEALEIDPDGILSQRPAEVELVEHKCVDFIEWMTECQRRRGAGHEMVVYDDPRRMFMGFIDYTDHKILFLSIHQMKRVSDEVYAQFGVSRDDFKSLAGRHKVVGERPLFEDSPTEPNDGGAAALESLWVAEVEATIGDEVREAEATHLEDQWAENLQFISPE
jgi:hypothetical protein